MKKLWQVQVRLDGKPVWFEQGEVRRTKAGRRRLREAVDRAREWSKSHRSDEIFVTGDPAEFVSVESARECQRMETRDSGN